jgi:putative acetyltransferase
MSVTVEPIDPGHEDALVLLSRLDAELAPLYPPEQRFAYSVVKLRESGTRFFVARRDGVAMGCAGLEVRGDFGELKRMYVEQTARGTGIAEALIGRIVDEAQGLGLPAIRLETGTFQGAAIRFYRRAGFRDIEPYGEYVGSPTSVCMEKAL